MGSILKKSSVESNSEEEVTVGLFETAPQIQEEIFGQNNEFCCVSTGVTQYLLGQYTHHCNVDFSSVYNRTK